MRTLEKRCEIRIAVLPSLSSLKRRTPRIRNARPAPPSARRGSALGFAHIGARDRDLLPFSAGEFDAILEPLADHLLIASGKLGDHLVGLTARRRALDARAVVPRCDLVRPRYCRRR